MNRIVLDTNILVSSLLGSGPPAIIVDMVAEGKLIPFYNDLIICEYWNVLYRPRFGFTSFQISHLIDSIVRIGIAVEATYQHLDESDDIFMPDEDDRKFYDVAKASLAFLITGNIKHFPSEPSIISPANFIRKYHQEAI